MDARVNKIVGILLLLSACLLSCNKQNNSESTDDVTPHGTHVDKLYCYFLSIDAFKPELSVRVGSVDPQTTLSLGLSQIRSDLEGRRVVREKYRVTGEQARREERALADTLMRYVCYDVGVDTFLDIMYGCISGPVRVYSDVEVDGRAPGEDLSDWLKVFAGYGRVTYPAWTYIKDEFMDIWLYSASYIHSVYDLWDAIDQDQFHLLSFSDYFTEGTVPFGLLGAGLGEAYVYPVKEHSTLFNGDYPIHFEIPVEGLDSQGQVTRVVLTASLFD